MMSWEHKLVLHSEWDFATYIIELGSVEFLVGFRDWEEFDDDTKIVQILCTDSRC
jgi:hypothetical protein